MEPFKISLQLYTIRSETASDFLGACERVAEIGYKWVELAGLGGFEPGELSRRLADMGIGISGVHAGTAVFEEPQKVIEESRLLNNRHVTVAWLPREFRDSADSFKRTGELLAKAAEEFTAADMRLGYHNHDFEFQEFDGKTGLDIIFENAPNLDAQIDVFWAQKGGFDPVALIPKFSQRMASIHAKDLGDDGEDIELGCGVLDWPHILQACEAAGVHTLVVEMDNPRLPPFESVHLSLRNLQGLLIAG